MSSPRTELAKSRSDLIEVLNEKFKNLPEWRAFRAIDNALAAFDAIATAATTSLSEAVGSATAALGKSYAELALHALTERGRPVTTPEMVEFIGKRRELPEDVERAKINISSAFSHDERLQSVPWQGGRAWWFAGRPVPAPRSQIAAE
jgi:hypothetical protein